MLRSVCVFCGSAFGKRQAYWDAAAETGKLLAQQGIRLVYGGGNVGLMGVVADACMAAGGEVTGVIPRSMLEREIAHRGLTKLHVEGYFDPLPALADHAVEEGFLRVGDRGNLLSGNGIQSLLEALR